MNLIIISVVLSSLSLGTTLVFSSSHWILAWIGLEINSLAILPFMTQPHFSRPVEASTKYFLAQASASALILFAIVFNAWTTGEWFINTMSNPLAVAMAIVGLMMKMGVAPLHTWLPEVMQGVTLLTCLIMSTWQKLAPFALLVQVTPPDSKMLLVMGLLSILVGGWGGLNQTQLRKLMAYSSTAHMGWVIVILQFSETIAFLTLIIYAIMTSSVFILFALSKATTINSLSISWSKAPVITTLTPFIVLSLGGMPPLTGFGPKWMILHTLSTFNLLVLATFAALSSLISLYFYLRVAHSFALVIAPNSMTTATLWRIVNLHLTLYFAIPTVLTLVLLPIIVSILSSFF
uniref:NADH-ubiquinone oxidoreductase chain 2 n=1 Tax=Nerophis ophidion TaxID=159077 RepID=A0A6B9SEN0_9TELE|nr:NADH dehydrogenase subunit 2 [Nerophis ophidion]